MPTSASAPPARPGAAAWAWAYGAALATVLALDALWLGFVARDFYAREMGSLMAPEVRWLPAAVFYLGYPAGLVALALAPMQGRTPPVAAALRGGLVGLMAYGTYDLTNLAVVRGWSVPLALADLVWGTVLSAAAAAAAAWVSQRQA